MTNTNSLNFDWDITYVRKNNNAERAVKNDICGELMNTTFSFLYDKLVKNDDDAATFNDVYLSLTNKCNKVINEADFIKLFTKEFKVKKDCYRRDEYSNSCLCYDVIYDAVVTSNMNDNG